MKTLYSLFFLLCTGSVSYANDSAVLRQISDNILLHGTCYENLRTLCKDIGHRLSGSPEAAAAVAWGAQALKDAGADTVWLQPVYVPQWVRGKESLQLRTGSKGIFRDVPVSSLGNSHGTNGKLLEAPVVMVQDFEALERLPDDAVKGKIVFFNYRFRQDFVITFHGYSDAVKYRSQGPNRASARGAAGVIIRSVSTAQDDIPHTGMTAYADSVQPIPAVAIGNTTADDLEAACKNGDAFIRLQSECRMEEPVLSWNVIGEIRGATYPDEIIVAGGHLDSWDVGEGAHDDGAGCVQSIEVIRTLKALDIQPKRTIRAVLFMNEENGVKGGYAYADSAKARGEMHIFAIESDAGGFTPRGIGMHMPETKKQKIRSYAPLFFDYGIYDFSREGGGVDIRPLQQQGVPVAGLTPDSQRYFDLHHAASDTFETVNHRELKLGAVAITGLVYLVSEHGL